MKKIFIPVIVVIAALMILVVFLTRGGTANDSTYHTHADGETHYGTHDTTTTTAPEYHTHADGETHYGEHS